MRSANAKSSSLATPYCVLYHTAYFLKWTIHYFYYLSNLDFIFAYRPSLHNISNEFIEYYIITIKISITTTIIHIRENRGNRGPHHDQKLDEINFSVNLTVITVTCDWIPSTTLNGIPQRNHVVQSIRRKKTVIVHNTQVQRELVRYKPHYLYQKNSGTNVCFILYSGKIKS